MPGAAKCGFRGPFPLDILRAAVATEFQSECFGDTALVTRLAFGDGKGPRQFGDPLLVVAFVFAVLLAYFSQFAAGSFQIHAGLIHLRMGSVFDRPRMLLPTFAFLDHPCFDRLDLLT